MDLQFTALLEGWAQLTQDQKVFVLNSFNYIKEHPRANDEVPGGANAVAAADPKTRGPHR